MFDAAGGVHTIADAAIICSLLEVAAEIMHNTHQ